MKLSFLCLVPALVLIARADTSAPYSGPEWAELDSGQALRAAAGLTLERYPNCDSITVDEKILEAYRPDGTAERQDDTYTKILTQKGKRDNAVLQQGFLLPYDTVKVVRLDIIHPDGRISAVDLAANSSESIDQSQMDMNIYDPNSRILGVNIPGLEVGDVIHSVIRTTTERPIIADQFSDEFILEGTQYIRHLSLEVRSPAGAPLRHVAIRDRVLGALTPSVRVAQDGSTVQHWEIEAVPRMYDEPAMPPYEMVLQRVLVSTMPDWKSVSRWYWSISAPHLAATTPDMMQTVERLTAGAPTQEAKIRAIFFYVSRGIRYMGVTPEKDRPGFEPHDVKLTFAKRYGVCRDKAGLLVALLRMAGAKAYPVLINVSSHLDPDVPSPYFNHAIVAVESHGRYVLMDPTDEQTRVLLPSYDENQTFLVCRPEGENLKISQVTPASDNMLQIRTTGTLAGDGTLEATSQFAFDGVNDDWYRGAFAQMKPDDRRRFFESRLQQVMPGATMTSLQISPDNILDETQPLRVEMRYSAPTMAAFGGHQAIVTMPWLGRKLGAANYFIQEAGLATRKYALITESTCGVDERISFRLAEGFGGPVSIPSATTANSDSVSYERSFEIGPRSITGSSVIKLRTVEFSPEQYLDLKRTLSGLDYDERKSPVMALTAPPAAGPAMEVAAGASAPVSSNAQVLLDERELIPTDAHTATLRVHYVKRILTYAGKVAESEVKIPYNPSTQEVALLHATVTSASGKTQENSPDEINLMDADWDASAKRYPGGKIWVDSLPGVDVGSTVDIAYEIKTHDRPYLADFEAFQEPNYVRSKTFRIVAAPGVRVATREEGSSGLITESAAPGKDGATVTEWTARAVEPLPEESGVPPDWAYEAGVNYFVGDATLCLRQLESALVDRAADGARAAALARHLADEAGTRLKAVRAIRDYVARNVRPDGPDFDELPLSDLSAADRTLADGYGHSADRAILTYAMLQGAGFHPAFVLASDLPAVNRLSQDARSFPLLDEFDAPLVKVSVDGADIYLNDTDQYARLGATEHDDRLAIDLAGGDYVVVKAAPDARTRVARVYSVSLAADGDARIRIKRSFYGSAFGEENKRFSEMRPEEKNRYFEQLVSDVAQGASPVGDLTADFSSYPGVEQFTVAVTRYAIADGRVFYLTLPFTPRLLATKTDRRTLPLLNTDDKDDGYEADITLPAAYPRAEIEPKAVDLTGPDGSGTVSVTSTGRGSEWVIAYNVQSRPAFIAPADYPAALKVESSLENRAARELLLEAAPDPRTADQPLRPSPSG